MNNWISFANMKGYERYVGETKSKLTQSYATVNCYRVWQHTKKMILDGCSMLRGENLKNDKRVQSKSRTANVRYAILEPSLFIVLSSSVALVAYSIDFLQTGVD